MANVIKHKRGSGSDPNASDLVVGEVAIRTDTGKLFTKMDNGSVAEIAGGGSDIAINTLSSSSGTGGGSATFNGSAYRFTLSSPPSVSAQQLLVSINGVIQKPVAGTGQPSEGFSVDGNDIILGDAPATGADFFIITFKSLGVSEPADNSVTSAKIVDGAIVNADINASAAIAGTKIAPDFGSQNISTTGNITATGNLTVQGAIQQHGEQLTIENAGNPTLMLNDTSAGAVDYKIRNEGGTFTINEGSTSRLAISSAGTIFVNGDGTGGRIFASSGNLSLSDGNGRQVLRIDDPGAGNSHAHIFDSNGRLGIGTTSPSDNLDIASTVPTLRLTDTDGGPSYHQIKGPGNGDLRISCDVGNTSSGASEIQFDIHDSNKMVIQSTGNVGIGDASPTVLLSLKSTTPTIRLTDSDASGTPECEIKGGGGDLVFSADRDNEKASTLMQFQTDGSTAMTIDSSQRVGIGTTSPDSILDISSGTPLITFNSTDTQLTQDELIGGIKVFKSDASGSGTGICGGIFWRSNDSVGARSYIQFTNRQNSTGQTNTDTECMRIDGSGVVTFLKLKLGSGNDHNGAKIVVQGSNNNSGTNAVFVKNSDETPLFQVRNDGAFFTGTDGTSPHNLGTSTNANVVVTSDGVLRRHTSSLRYKKDIADATWGLADVLNLKAKTFKNNNTGEFADDKTYAGFIAEDIHALGLTEFVEYNDANEPDALNYASMVALMAKAIQDLNAKVEALEAG